MSQLVFKSIHRAFILSFVIRLMVGVLCCWIWVGCSVKHLAEVVSLDSPVLAAPLNSEQLRVKQKFVVTLITLAGGCDKPGETSVKVSGLRAEVRPYNRTPFNLGWCALVIRTYPRQVSLQFDSPGVATIRVFSKGEQGEIRLIERQVEVTE